MTNKTYDDLGATTTVDATDLVATYAPPSGPMKKIVATDFFGAAPWAIRGVTPAADKLAYFTSASAAALTDFTSVARTLVGQSTQALMRTTGLGMSADGSSLVSAADYAAMRDLLDLVPGTDVQPYSAQLTAIAANSTNGFWARSGSGTGAARTITGTASQIGVTNGDGVSGNPVLALLGNALALAGLTGAADKLAYFTGAAAMAVTNLVSQARSFLADPSSAYVNFLNTPTGSVTRTVQAKLQDVKSVLDFIPVALHANILAGTSTDDVGSYFQLAFNWLITASHGGELQVPPGRYHIATQATIDRTPGASGEFFNIRVSAYGAQFTTAGNIYPFKFYKGGAEQHLTWAGGEFLYYNPSNGAGTDAKGGFILQGASNTTFDGVVAIVGNCSDTSFAFYKLEQTNVSDNNTATFWVRWPNCKFRGVASTIANVPAAIWSYGSNNDLEFCNSWWSACAKVLKCTPSHMDVTTVSSISNGVRAIGGSFESVDYIFYADAAFTSSTVRYAPYGWVIMGCRCEDINNAYIGFFNVTINSAQPPIIAYNIDFPDLTGAYFECATSGIYRNILQPAYGATPQKSREYFYSGKVVQALTDHAASFQAEQGYGTEWLTPDGTTYVGRARYVGGAYGVQFEIGSNITANLQMVLTGLNGIGTSARLSQNLSGVSAALSSGSRAVTFPYYNEPDTSYDVYLTPTGPCAASCYVADADKTVSGFTIRTSDTASTATVRWLLVGR